MRHMSFALTTPQFLDGSKTVTRRLGWVNLKPGDRVRAVKKAMGLKPGEKIESLGVIEIVDVSREPLSQMIEGGIGYGQGEARMEGFPHLNGQQFVAMFCEHMKATPDTIVTRIEFKKVD